MITWGIKNHKSNNYNKAIVDHRDSNASVNIHNKFERTLENKPELPEFNRKYWKGKILQNTHANDSDHEGY